MKALNYLNTAGNEAERDALISDINAGKYNEGPKNMNGVTINAVAPGFIETDMTAALTDDVKEKIAAGITLGRLGQVEDIAEAVAFLASDKASYITGQVLEVAGGLQ